MSTFNCPHGLRWEEHCEMCIEELRNDTAELNAEQAYSGKPSRGQVDGDHYKKLPIQPLPASSAVSEMPATAVGSANGRSTSASMIFLPGKV